MKKIYIILFVVAISLCSCKKWLEINPKQSIDAKEALTNTTGINATLVSVYSRLQNYTLYGRDYFALSEALSDNTVHTSSASHLQSESSNARNAHFVNWQIAYYAINQANLVIDAVNTGDFEESWKANTLGQAYFLRALCYHDLVKVYAYDPTADIPTYNYGGVPLSLVGVDDLGKIASMERVSVDKIYTQIYDDLDKAHGYLSTKNSTTIYKATKAAVSALYSRVALFRGDYPKSIDMATQALSESTAVFSSNAKFISDWRLETHPESIFELKFNTTEVLASERSLRGMFNSRATYDATVYSVYGVVVVNPTLVSLYGATDVRKGLIRNGVGTNASRSENYKFITKGTINNLVNIPILRLSEVYLNRAEAYARSGASGEGNSLLDLNKIRNRAGLTDVTLSGTALIDEIMLQRRLELAFEGQRWFDLKRTGKDINKGTGNIVSTDYRVLAPLPVREVTASKGVLKQNFNY